MIRKKRVVITGMGVVAPNGIGLEKFWKSLLAGESGVGLIASFDASQLESRIAGEGPDFDPLEFIEPELKPKRMGRHTQFAYAAAMMALKDSEAKLPGDSSLCVPVVIGVSTSAMDVLEQGFQQLSKHGARGVSPTVVANCQPQAPANAIADRLGSSARAATISSACPSGLDAIIQAAAMIRDGEAEIAIAGGSDSPITPLGMASFIACGLSSSRNGQPEKAGRPFDADSDSGVISEGAGVFVLEDFEHAEARGAKIYVEIAGYSKQRDLDRSTPAAGLEASMRLALANAGRGAEDVDYISAYGPGHPVLDAIEVEMIKRVFGASAYTIPVSSIKGVTGNALAAGGCFQLISTALTIRHQTIIPTTNFEIGRSDCDLDFVADHPRKASVNCALINVRGLGGSASSLVVKRVRN